MKTKQTILLALALLVSTITFSQVSVSVDNTVTPDESAMLTLESKSAGFLPPRMTDAQRNMIANPAPGLTIYNITENCLQWWDGTSWFNGCREFNSGNEIIDPFPVGTVHCNPASPTAIVEVTGVNGRIWMDRNLGAGQVATSKTDVAAYGDLFQWGRAADGHQCRNSTVSNGPVTAGNEGSNFITNTDLPFAWLSPQDNTRWADPKGPHDPCPTGFRVPTEPELDAERLAFNPSNANGAFASSLKLTSAGVRDGSNTGTIEAAGLLGRYWTTNPQTNSGVGARGLVYNDGAALINDRRRADGFSVRCIKIN